MDQIALRLYMVLCTAIMWVQAYGQVFDEDEDILQPDRRRDVEDVESLEDYMNYQPIHFSFYDVLMVMLLLLACYIFGKIWKGCSYLLLIVAAIFFYLTHS